MVATSNGLELSEKRMKRSPQPAAAFTLLEIMLVVAIIALLLATAIFKLRGNLEAAQTVAVKSDISNIRTQLNSYRMLAGDYPTSEQGLQALVAQPESEPKPSRWVKLFDSVPKDPYGTFYIYRYPGEKNTSGFDLFSAGPDKQVGTADDDWGQ